MCNDYKRQAINAFLTEMYGGEDNPKYSTKYKDLKERALHGHRSWIKQRQILLEDNDEQLA